MLGPVGLAYTIKQMAKFDHIADGCAKTMNRQHWTNRQKSSAVSRLIVKRRRVSFGQNGGRNALTEVCQNK